MYISNNLSSSNIYINLCRLPVSIFIVSGSYLRKPLGYLCNFVDCLRYVSKLTAVLVKILQILLCYAYLNEFYISTHFPTDKGA